MVIDLQDPMAPVEYDGSVIGTGGDMALGGPRLFLATDRFARPSQVHVTGFDVRDPLQPQLLTVFSGPTKTAGSQSVSLSEDHILIGTQQGLWILKAPPTSDNAEICTG
ncbi:MAG: hypothetical protein QOF51_1919 [Chloroflexota bacterium]|nr:hypothetical protein [Chloroflexota bacterium]